jgi:hypothetical protein
MSPADRARLSIPRFDRSDYYKLEERRVRRVCVERANVNAYAIRGLTLRDRSTRATNCRRRSRSR